MKKVLLNRRSFFQLAAAAGATVVTPKPLAELAKPPAPYFRAPAGTILHFAGDTPPDGWMVAAGQALDPKRYADLFRVVGYAYGRREDHFLLPDMRAVPGLFNVPDQKGHVHSVVGPAHSHSVSAELSATPPVQPTMVLNYIILTEDIEARCEA